MVSLSVPQNRPWALDGEPGESNRHRKGDTYLIGGKPYDPLDPGPWQWRAAPGFQPDRRTGRHRRGELPDPLPEPRRPRPEPAATFDKLREDAWTRFLDVSEPLARDTRLHAHQLNLTTNRPARGMKVALRRGVHATLRFLTAKPSIRA